MNLLLSLIIVAVWLIAAATGRAYGGCCPRTYIQWAEDTHWPFSNCYMRSSRRFLLPRCKFATAKVCNDGRVHDGRYCGKGKCDEFGCNCFGGCISGDPVENFRHINNIPDAVGGAWVDPTTWNFNRFKRSNIFLVSRAGPKIIKSGYKGYKEGQLSADTSRRDAERARNNAATVPPPVTPSLVQRAVQKYKPGH